MRGLELRFERLPRYGVLLAALFVELIVAPAMIATETGVLATRAATILVLLAALFAAEARRAGFALFAVTVAANLAAIAWEDPYLHAFGLLLRVVFVGYVIAILLWTILQRETVTLDTIAGAACGYMLVGAAFSAAFLLLETLRPGSFDVAPAWRTTSGNPGPGLVYFSYATLTTVGYGDIHPTWPAAGGLAIAEAVMGQLYLAVTVARLVGLHVARPR